MRQNTCDFLTEQRAVAAIMRTVLLALFILILTAIAAELLFA
jgi:hypothetical protein